MVERKDKRGTASTPGTASNLEFELVYEHAAVGIALVSPSG
jgi:hypothetical protein